ncbi:hypothetical protein BpHYR1_020610 [Brachionus plicatilis]|uniref:Uncharacterized protein n=1 Tax=Brachionus plicatilis TaxID=10195 RepID=A0A3M7PQ99_BRAPC|nr:hypothetical protein BpHYR1_020610 [Brachionus plicatilis]
MPKNSKISSIENFLISEPHFEGVVKDNLVYKILKYKQMCLMHKKVIQIFLNYNDRIEMNFTTPTSEIAIRSLCIEEHLEINSLN